MYSGVLFISQKIISIGYHAISLTTQTSDSEVSFHKSHLFLPLDFIMRKCNGFELLKYMHIEKHHFYMSDLSSTYEVLFKKEGSKTTENVGVFFRRHSLLTWLQNSRLTDRLCKVTVIFTTIKRCQDITLFPISFSILPFNDFFS